jgi:hypothetical protein
MVSVGFLSDCILDGAYISGENNAALWLEKHGPVTSRVTRPHICPISKGLMIINHLHVGMAF